MDAVTGAEGGKDNAAKIMEELMGRLPPQLRPLLHELRLERIKAINQLPIDAQNFTKLHAEDRRATLNHLKNEAARLLSKITHASGTVADLNAMREEF